MSLEQRFGPPAVRPASDSHLAEVVSVQDPDNRNRIQVRLLSFDGVTDQDAPLWARVAVPFAGASCGAFLIPDVGDEVLVTFVNGDPRLAVVVGALWNGKNAAPESLGGSRVDRWTLVGTNGTRIAIVEESAGQATIEFSTPGGVKGTLTDEGGGKVKFETSTGTSITLDSSGITLDTPSQVKVNASTTEINSGSVTVNAGMSRFSGVVQCDTLIATTVVGTTYTPGAGNVW